MNKIIIVLLLLMGPLNAQTPLTNTFTYQGELKFNNALVNGSYDFRFSVFNVETGGSALEALVIENVTVTNGVFTTPITLTNDLFTGNKIWLGIEVKTNGTADPFELLSPRQEVTSSPYAIHAQFVGADAVTGVQIQNGSIDVNDIDTGSVQSRIIGSCVTGQYVKSVNVDGTLNCSGNIIGSTNTLPFQAIVNNKRVIRIDDRVDLGLTHAPSITLGGDSNSVSDYGSTISGGYLHTITNINSTIGGGIFNNVSGEIGTIGGGTTNEASGNISTISGGSNNTAGGYFSSVGGGINNQATGNRTTVGGGEKNLAIGSYSTSPGGLGNQAGGRYSFATGKYAIVRDSAASVDLDGDEGTFIWSDATATDANRFTSTGPNQFLIRATGGVGIGTNNPNGQQLYVLGSSYLRNDSDTSIAADLVLGGGSTNATDDGVLTSDLSIAGSDLFIKSNDAVLVTIDTNNDGDSGRFEVRSASAGTLLEVQEDGTVNIPGSLNVTGTISKSGGTFKIDHPLDPKNKYLYHSFIESPDMMNVYNGNITTDKHGEAWVELPEYFEALNRDFRYQLTVIGSFARAMVAEEISDNQFLIKTDEPDVKVSWQVTGIRQDAYAQKNRVQVEVDKPISEKGSYLYPEAWEVTEELE